MSKNITKAEAANVLSDEIFGLSIAIERLALLCRRLRTAIFKN